MAEGRLRRLWRWLLRRRAPAPPPSPIPLEPPVEYRIGLLRVRVVSHGERAPLGRQRRVVYEVTVTDDAGNGWSSRYGLEPPGHSSRAAAEAALDELDRIHRDQHGWVTELVGGMGGRAAEAVRESPQTRRDLEAAGWVGPALAAMREQRDATGTWLGEGSAPA
jgi:hypothetical protein